MFTGREDLADYGSEGDEEALEAFLDGFSTPEERDRVIVEMTKGLPPLVEKNRAAIQKVATELLRKEKVSTGDLDRILKGILILKRQPSFWRRIISRLGLARIFR